MVLLKINNMLIFGYTADRPELFRRPLVSWTVGGCRVGSRLAGWLTDDVLGVFVRR